VGWVTFPPILVFLWRFVLDFGQHLSDASRDLATFTFDLGGHCACRWCGSSCSVCVPSLNFVGLPVRKILGIYCVNINPSGDLDLWPLNRKTVSLPVYPKVIPYTVWALWDHSFLAKRDYVTFGYAMANPSVRPSVCLSSVTCVHPTQWV